LIFYQGAASQRCKRFYQKLQLRIYYCQILLLTGRFIYRVLEARLFPAPMYNMLLQWTALRSIKEGRETLAFFLWDKTKGMHAQQSRWTKAATGPPVS
jgi:hypothetical protein